MSQWKPTSMAVGTLTSQWKPTRLMNKVNARRARLLLPGWVTIFGRVYNLGM